MERRRLLSTSSQPLMNRSAVTLREDNYPETPWCVSLLVLSRVSAPKTDFCPFPTVTADHTGPAALSTHTTHSTHPQAWRGRGTTQPTDTVSQSQEGIRLLIVVRARKCPIRLFNHTDFMGNNKNQGRWTAHGVNWSYLNLQSGFYMYINSVFSDFRMVIKWNSATLNNSCVKICVNNPCNAPR